MCGMHVHMYVRMYACVRGVVWRACALKNRAYRENLMQKVWNRETNSACGMRVRVYACACAWCGVARLRAEKSCVS